MQFIRISQFLYRIKLLELLGSTNTAAVIQIVNNRINSSDTIYWSSEMNSCLSRTAVASEEKLLALCAIDLSLEYFNSPTACPRRRRVGVGNQAMNASTKIVHHISPATPSLPLQPRWRCAVNKMS